MYYHVRPSALLCVLGSLGLTLAASSCSKDITISNAGALKTAFIDCPTWTGDIVVQNFNIPKPTSSTTSSPPGISIPTLKAVVSGGLLFSNIGISADSKKESEEKDAAPQPSGAPFFSISAPQLQSVEKALSFQNMDNVALGDFSALGSVAGISISNVNFGNSTSLNNSVDAGSLPALRKLQSISVTKTTNLVAIGQFSPELETPNGEFSASVTAIDNSDLSAITLGFAEVPAENGFTNVEITTEGNNDGLSVDLSDISHASLNLKGVFSFAAESLETLVSDSTIGTQILSDNTFTTLGLSGVTSITGTMKIQNNKDLNSVYLTKLDQVGSLKFLNNELLSSNNVIVPASVKGQITLDCSKTFNCASLSLDTPNSCTCGSAASGSAASASPSSANSPESNQSGSSSGNGGLSSDAKIGIGVGVGVGVALLLATVLIFCFCSRSRRRSRDNPREVSAVGYSRPPPNYSDYSKVPHRAGPPVETRESSSKEYTQTRGLDAGWHVSEQSVHPTQRTVQLEQQQSMRHEMDARSLPDIDYDEDDGADTRSLEDIERVHGQR